MSLNATVEAKKLQKYDLALEKQIRSWIAGLLPEQADACNNASLSLDALLKSGVVLLDLLRAIVPGKAPAPSKMTIAFKQMENIQNYLKACVSAVGMQQTELFETLDLYEARNMPVVLAHLAVLKFVSEKYLKGSPDLTGESARPKPKVLAGPPPAEKKSPVISPKFAVEPKKKAPESPVKRPDKSGADVTSLADDVAAKEEFKFDTEVAAAVKKWMEQCLDVQIPDLISSIKSGVLLCKLLNKVKPNMIPKIYEGGVAYLQMENLDRYIKGCVELGISGTELFETNDLVNEKNLSLVVTHLHALAMFLQKRVDLRWTGPQIESVSSRSLFSATLIGGELSDTPIPESPLTPVQAELLTWANFNIMRSGRVDMTISNLTTDVRTSVKLIFLVEQLLQAPSGVPYNRSPTHMWHAMQNASLLLRYISSQTFEKVEGVRAADVVLGNSAQIARLLAYLRDKFDLDFMFKGLLGPDIDIDAAGLADAEDEMVEIELEEGEAVPDYLRTFIAATDLAEIDEEHSHTHQSDSSVPADEKTHDLDSEVPDDVSAESPRRHEPEVQEPEPQPEVSSHEKAPRRPSNAAARESPHHHHTHDEKHVSPRTLDIPVLPIPVEEKTSPRRKSSTGSAPRHSPISSPRSPTGEKPNLSPRDAMEPTSPDGHSSPSRPRGASIKKHHHSPHYLTPAGPAEPEKIHPEPISPRPTEPEAVQTEVASPRPIMAPGSEVAPSTSQEETPQSDSATKPKRPRKSTDKTDAKIIVPHTRTKSPRRTPAEGSSKKTGQKRKVKVYKTKAQADAAAAQPVGKGRPRAGSLSLSVDQQKRVADAQAAVRLRVAQELLKTEQNYVNSLSVLIDGFINRARQESILNAEEIAQVFANIEDIRAFSRQFESELFQLIENQKDTAGIAELLLRKAGEMEAVYEPFISNYNNFMISLQFLQLKNPRLVALQAAFEDELMKTTMYNVESFVIMPVQRIPRYVLLLKDILKYTPKESPACLVFANAIQSIDQMLKQLNSKIDREQIEHLRRQVLIAQSIDPVINILSPKRRYVGETALSIKRFKVLDSKKADDSRRRKSAFKKSDYMFIMSDIIVFCSSLQAKTEEQKQYSYVETVPTSELIIASNENALLSAGLSAKNPFKGDKKKQDCQFVFVHVRDGTPVEWWLAEQRTPPEKDAVISVLRTCVTFSAQ